MLPYLLANLTNDGRVLGLLGGSYALAQFAFTPLIGALSDRFGRKPVITLCVAGSVVGARVRPMGSRLQLDRSVAIALRPVSAPRDRQTHREK